MPNVSPRVIFWLSFAVTCCIGITNGTVHFTAIVPHAWIEPADEIIAGFIFFASTFLTMAAGAGMSKQSVLASAAAIPEVQRIVTTPEVADAAPSEKVVPPLPPGSAGPPRT